MGDNAKVPNMFHTWGSCEKCPVASLTTTILVDDLSD
jgi:hypothetical protein